MERRREEKTPRQNLLSDYENQVVHNTEEVASENTSMECVDLILGVVRMRGGVRSGHNCVADVG